ncbi:MAG: Ca2+-binding protein toxin-related [Tardiphaga sp.]|jgi:Ca2+-binding RTX toxin-like protein|nr:Ca2+-binding protein toxin-related [Tardiphaga sp.]
MDERLSLGIPDRSAIDAPARRFALIEERSRVSSIVPAILVASWGLLLKQMFGSGKEEAPHQPKMDSPGRETAQPETEPVAAPSTTERTPGSSELVRAFIGSVSMNEAFAPAVDLDKLSFAKTDGPRLSLVPANQNAPAGARPQPPAGEAKPAGGSGGGGGGGGSDPHTPDGKLPYDPKKPPPGSKDPPTNPPKRANHAPVSAGAVDLGSGLVNESIIISLSQLLTGTRDPDGDALSVQSLHVDYGSVQALEPDRWLYTPEHDEAGPVHFSYRITDGIASIAQTANADLHLTPENEIHGTDGDDFLIGTPRNDLIDAGAGSDIVYGREGNDTIYGGAGDDRIVGGAGDDILFGGSGNDTMFGGAGNDTLFGDGGNDILYGEDGNDLIMGGDGDDFASGGPGNDTILGGADNDTLSGDAGNDRIDAGCGDDVIILSINGGHDIITGGSGTDTLDLSQIVFDANVDLPDGIVEIGDGQTAQIFEIENVRGGHGRDRLVADAHVNIMEGGDGDDAFVFRDLASLKNDDGPRDHIVDFSVGDKLDLSRVGQELDDFAGQKLFFAGAYQAKFDEVGAITYHHEIVPDTQDITVITGNLDGNPEHNFEIVLDGNLDLDESNFVLTAAHQGGNAQHGT